MGLIWWARMLHFIPSTLGNLCSYLHSGWRSDHRIGIWQRWGLHVGTLRHGGQELWQTTCGVEWAHLHCYACKVKRVFANNLLAMQLGTYQMLTWMNQSVYKSTSSKSFIEKAQLNLLSSFSSIMVYMPTTPWHHQTNSRIKTSPSQFHSFTAVMTGWMHEGLVKLWERIDTLHLVNLSCTSWGMLVTNCSWVIRRDSLNY